MALFKVFKGTSANLPEEKHDGYCYFTTDDGLFYIDYLDEDGVTLRRRPISGPGASVEYIIGEQTAATGSWTGTTKDSSLETGKTIAYKLPFAGSGNASLTLTFTNPTGNANSGAIPVYTNTSRVTTHYGAGSVILLIYDGTNWRASEYWNSNSRDPGYGKITPGDTSSATSAITPNTTQITAGTYNENLIVNPGNKWIELAGAQGDTNGTDILTIGHAVPNSISNTGPSTGQTPGYNSTFNIPVVSVDQAGHVTGISTTTVKIPASDNTNTTYTLSGSLQNNGSYKATLTPSSGASSDATIPLMAAAAASSAGATGLVPAPGAGAQTKYLRGDASWQTVDWSELGNKPSSFTPSSHAHGNITNTGELGTASRVVVTNSDKKITTSGITTTELGYLDGVTSNIQTQLNTLSSTVTGLSGAMHFRGTTTSEIVDGSTTNPITVNGSSYTAEAGDVVLREITTGNIFEYVWTGSTWEMLGRDTSFKVQQNAVTSPSASGSTTAFIDTISQDTNGVITATKKNLPSTALATDTGTSSITLAYGGKYKLTAAGSSVIFTMPSSDNTNTATAADNILDGSNSGTQITYAPYTSQQSKLSFDTSSTAPTRTDRLNLNGYLYATKLYSGGTEVKTKQTAITDSTGTSETSTATRFVYSVSQNANGEISVKTRPLPTYNNYSLPLAASGTRGGIQIGYSESGTNYAVKLSSEKAYVTVPWTDTKVTSVDNHYTPSANNDSELTATLSGTAGTYALNTEYTVLTGVKAQRDAKGHVVGITYTAQKIKDTNNTYTVGNKALKVASNSGTATQAITVNENSSDRTLTISGDGTYITGAVSGSSNVATITLSHATPSGLTTGSYGNSSNQTPGYGSTFNVPYITVDAGGHITAISNKTVKIPASDNTNTASAVDDILDGSNSGTAITYAPYTTQQSKLSFDTSTTNPTRTDRLNLNGYMYATKYNVAGKVALEYDSTLEVLNFVFA